MDDEIEATFHDGEIEARRRYGSVTGMRGTMRMVRRTLSSSAIEFIRAQRFFFIATANHLGECDCSFRGSQDGTPALTVLSESELAFPDYGGNNLFNSLGNILVNPQVGMLFVAFDTGARFRVNGTAEIVEDAARFGHIWPEALRYVMVKVVQAFPNCKRRVPNLGLDRRKP